MKRVICAVWSLLMAAPVMAAEEWHVIMGKDCVPSPPPNEVVKILNKTHGYTAARISSQSVDRMKAIEMLDGSGNIIVMMDGRGDGGKGCRRTASVIGKP